MKAKVIPALVLAFGIALWANAQSKFIAANAKELTYQGRITYKGDHSVLSWTGNSVQISFKGTGIGAVLKDEGGLNYLKVILDGKPLPDIHPDSTKHGYQLASQLSDDNHTLQLFKRTEFVHGDTWLYGFELPANAVVNKAPKAPKRAIEFYGNSITCGYGTLDTSGKDRGTPEFEDGYLSYAALTSRYFNARYSCIARSGIGIMVSWFPQIMPELYDRQDPSDSLSKWDFSKYKPQVVVVNLMQNDSWITKLPDNAQYKARFTDVYPDPAYIINAYTTFIRNIRSKYPKATIVCMLGNMDISKPGSDWRGYVAIAVKQLHDKKILSFIVNYKNTPGHPKVAEQADMAKQLEAFIEQHTGWEAEN
ncbi:SGNH/GDSL hydrolase family protein [Mucilaginibacter ginkgonis]|uniref:Electron transporter RnfD n=1 Tax=Mucilaginibacter ginkgonis TaxID=2682091 RepID=A0A6I4IMT2_9SPHI|nr:SGNH/GDSL hydrolase family protein [Mucilaginibacter ginkgonis]QQL50985.1 electron transporter RnfD [Mucilaginibacter ginkgonis]